MTASYTLLTEFLRFRGPKAAWRKVRRSTPPAVKASWRFWPFVHALTFSVVPLHLRVLWVDVLEIVWVSILSTCVNNAEAPSVITTTTTTKDELTAIITTTTTTTTTLETVLPDSIDLTAISPEALEAFSEANILPPQPILAPDSAQTPEHPATPPEQVAA